MTTTTKTRKARTYRKGGDVTEKVHIDFHNLLEQMLDPAVPAHMGTTYSAFKAGANGTGYSFMNQVWLWLQGAKGPVAPFGTWKSFNRFPRKGTAKSVLHPIVRTGTSKDANGNPVIDPKTGKAKKYRYVAGFTPKNTAFDFADTFGEDIDIAAIAANLENWELSRALENLDIEQVEYELMDGNTQGYSTGRQYALNPVAAHPLKTMFHEMAHIVLGHTAQDTISAYQDHRGIMEFAAEAVAYLVAHELDLENWDASESRAYVRTWLQGDEVSDTVIQKVFGAANKILEAGREELPEANEA